MIEHGVRTRPQNEYHMVEHEVKKRTQNEYPKLNYFISLEDMVCMFSL